MASILPILRYVEPGEVVRQEVTLATGKLRFIDHTNRAGLSFTVADPVPEQEVVSLRLTRTGIVASRTNLAGGPVVFEIENASGRRAALMAPNFPGAGGAAPPMDLPRALTGKQLFVTQTFRDLFGGETVSHEDGLSLKDITVLFSDLKGSTDLYDRIGDVRAFHLVQQHFERLAGAVRRHHGAIVKTIGDAVMATFAAPSDAVAAALEMSQALEDFNRERGGRDLALKLGIHRGASIAVTLNARLDYFGQAVNIASRVQALAEADEVCVTADVLRDEASTRLLAGYAPALGDVQLKGVARPVRVARIRLQGEPPAA